MPQIISLMKPGKGRSFLLSCSDTICPCQLHNTHYGEWVTHRFCTCTMKRSRSKTQTSSLQNSGPSYKFLCTKISNSPHHSMRQPGTSPVSTFSKPQFIIINEFTFKSIILKRLRVICSLKFQKINHSLL